MRGLGVAPIPIGYYEDLGATGWLGQRRSAIFKPKEMGWVLPRKMEGMFVSEDGRLFKGPHRCWLRDFGAHRTPS